MTKFKKTDAQSAAVERIASTAATDIMLFGGSRSAKTFLAVYIIIVRACKCQSNHIIVRNTFNSVKNSIWLETLPTVLRLAFPGLSVQWDKTNYRLIFPNGSVIKCAGLDSGDKLERLLGLSFSTILVEECNQVPWVAVQRLKTRLADKNILIKKTFYTQNPTTTTSPYYQAFEQGVDPIDGVSYSSERMGSFLAIKMNPQSNIANLDDEYLKMLAGLPEKERKRFLNGEYDSDNDGAAAYAFNREDHVSEEAVKQPGTIFVGSDFNIAYNSDIIASQTAHYLYVWDEIQILGDTYKKCDALKRKGATGASVVADGTGKARRTTGKSDHIIMKEAGFNLIYQVNPRVVDKMANLNRCLSLGLIKIHPRCKMLIRDLTQVVWDKDMQLDQRSDPSLTHLLDSLSYLCWKLFPLVKSPQNKTHSQRR